jgi:hypothetical protein
MAISSVLGLISWFHIFSSAIISEATPIFVLLSGSCTTFHCHKLPLLVMKLKAKDMGKKSKKKNKLFPAFNELSDMDVWIHVFLTSSLVGGE